MQKVDDMSQTIVTRVRMYRFNDRVAVTFEWQGGMTSTLYMEAALAYMVAAQIDDLTVDINDCKFTDSVEGTWLAEITPGGAQLRKE